MYRPAISPKVLRSKRAVCARPPSPASTGTNGSPPSRPSSPPTGGTHAWTRPTVPCCPLHARYRLAAVFCDPYQLHRSITTLAAAGLPIQEWPQTLGHTTQMGQTLFDLVTGRNLRLYAADDLRQQAL